MNFDPSRPIFLQIAEEMKRRVVRGTLARGDKVPSVRDLAGELKVNPNTVASAYAELERQGFLFTRRGQGTFVTEDARLLRRHAEMMVHERAVRLVRELRELGMDRTAIRRLLQDATEEA